MTVHSQVTAQRHNTRTNKIRSSVPQRSDGGKYHYYAIVRSPLISFSFFSVFFSPSRLILKTSQISFRPQTTMSTSSVSVYSFLSSSIPRTYALFTGEVHQLPRNPPKNRISQSNGACPWNLYEPRLTSCPNRRSTPLAQARTTLLTSFGGADFASARVPQNLNNRVRHNPTLPTPADNFPLSSRSTAEVLNLQLLILG
jgi:hypothetical protein